jgi:hydroxyacylglutathione hydrolase
MKVEQIYTGCLAQGAYYIESDGEAAIIDPLREVNTYINKAQKNGATIKYIFETHFHADFVSGHLELSQKTNAPIIYGPKANPSFESIIATDGQVFELGKIKIQVLHTPGHTMESSCYLLFDENGKEYCIFTGDTLFIGDVGRPDLAQKSDLTVHDLAGYLYDSLRNKILPLPNHIIVYPAHGAGSACGKNMSKETFDSLGHQKQINYALQEQNKEDFIKVVTDGLTPPPYYFPKNVQLNKTGSASLETVMESGLQTLSPEAFEVAANETGAIILDTRQAADFKDAFIPNSINIGLSGDFAPWVGTLITDIQQPIIFIADAGTEKEVITRLSRVGYDNILGYLAGGVEAWKAAGKETDSIESISAEEFADLYQKEDLVVKDVRKNTEFEAEHLANAENVPLAYISENMTEFSKKDTNYIHCAGGYRSMIAASILKSRGFDNVINVEGGIGAIKTLLPTSDLASSL